MTVAELLGRQSHFLAGRGNMRGLLLATAFILICFLQCAKGWCKTAGQSNINVMKCHIIGSAYFTLNLNAVVPALPVFCTMQVPDAPYRAHVAFVGEGEKACRLL